jgi:hypothetical protein
MEILMKNRNQHLLLNEKQSSIGIYLFGLSALGELSNNFTKQSNFVENIVEDQGENIQSDMDDTKKRTALKCNMYHSEKNDLIDYKKKEISTVVGLLSVFN